MEATWKCPLKSIQSVKFNFKGSEKIIQKIAQNIIMI